MYTFFMRSNHQKLQSLLSGLEANSTSSSHSASGQSVFGQAVFGQTKRSVPFIPGALLILLGVVVLLAPRLLLAAIAFCLLALGGLFCYVAYKIVAIRKQINTLSKNIESSLYTGSFTRSKSDIDITDLDEKKIILH